MASTEKLEKRKSDLPFGSEFSPSKIRLDKVLELAEAFDGDWKALENAIYIEYFSTYNTNENNKRKLANNTKLGMQAYGLLDKSGHLTETGKYLFSLVGNDQGLYNEFARHILLHLHGLTLVQCVVDIQTSGEKVNLRKLRKWLEERGVHFPRGGKYPSSMRLWLEKAGVFKTGWQVVESKIKLLTGIDSDELDVLAGFTLEQKAYLRTLANLNDGESYSSNDIERMATAIYGIEFNEKNLARQVLYPLKESGYITLTRGTKSSGRGAKPFVVTSTSKLVSDIVIPVLNQLDKQVDSDVRHLLRKSLKAILVGLETSDKNLRGLALEALAFKLMHLLDMTYVATRLRGKQTGGAEVDLIFESTRLVFSRWQIQCKNTKAASLDDIAKEVGLTHFLKSNVIVIVTTGRIGSEARRYSNKVMVDSNLCFVLIDGADLRKITENQTTIIDIFEREAKQAMKLKEIKK
jgi:site-specific DNA-methyltransferase (cytosine-N4-specific)